MCNALSSDASRDVTALSNHRDRFDNFWDDVEEMRAEYGADSPQLPGCDNVAWPTRTSGACG